MAVAATSRPSCHSCASAEAFSKYSNATTSRPDIPSCTLSSCVRSHPSLEPEPPRGIFRTVCSSTRHHCLILSSLPVFSVGAELPLILLCSFLPQLGSYSHLSMHRQFKDELLFQLSIVVAKMFTFCACQPNRIEKHECTQPR